MLLQLFRYYDMWNSKIKWKMPLWKLWTISVLFHLTFKQPLDLKYYASDS